MNKLYDAAQAVNSRSAGFAPDRSMSSQDLVHAVLGDITLDLGFGGRGCQSSHLGTTTCNPADMDVGLLLHEFGHHFDWGLGGGPSADLAEGEITDTAGNHVTGKDPDIEDFQRTFSGYRCSSVPCVYAGKKHPQWNTPYEDFADMYSNWTTRGFADDIGGAGSARNIWMEVHMPGWLAEIFGP